MITGEPPPPPGGTPPPTGGSGGGIKLPPQNKTSKPVSITQEVVGIDFGETLGYALEPIFKTILSSTASSVLIPIASNVETALLVITGRIGGTGGAAWEVDTLMQINSNALDVYSWTRLLQNNGVTGSQDMSDPSIIIGQLTADAATTGHAGTITVLMPHIGSTYMKTTLSFSTLPRTSSSNAKVNMQAGFYTGLTRVSSITLKPDTATYANAVFAAGTSITIYGFA